MMDDFQLWLTWLNVPTDWEEKSEQLTLIYGLLVKQIQARLR